ncbi:hypothetical protein Bca52824_094232 [Brassica carinata]|uniref:Uncharacterized protein n=1 Tax=Brassica carinata TaxID=52824 RepID=A0A8X7P3Z9_BRACI|nr:hypothetical protein Bca52824_094232 [Brassica carinata]
MGPIKRGFTNGGRSGEERLPTHLFATDQFPSKRNNCYSSLEYLLLVRDVLESTK